MKIIIFVLSFFLLFACNTTTKLAKPNGYMIKNITTDANGKPLSEREVIDKVNSLADIYGVKKIKKPAEDLNKPINQVDVCKGYCIGRFTKMSEQSYCKLACEKKIKQKSQQ
jgi:hypothetical protein